MVPPTRYALDASASAELVGISGFQLSGNVGVRINKLGTAINDSVMVGDTPVPVKFDDGADVMGFSATDLTIDVAGFSLRGNFAFSKEVDTKNTPEMTDDLTKRVVGGGGQVGVISGRVDGGHNAEQGPAAIQLALRLGRRCPECQHRGNGK